MTKQRRWQIKMVRKGKCKICGAPAVTKFHCEKHRLAVNTRAREALHRAGQREASLPCCRILWRHYRLWRRSGLRTHIATTESVSLSEPVKI
jgi:hypothetical protein